MPKGFRGSLMIFSATLLLAFTNAPVVLADPAPAAEAAKPAAAPAPAPAPAPKPTTTSDPNVAIEDLKLMIEPMTKPELEVEANGWFGLLQAKVREISDAELAVRHKNREIAALKDVKKAAKEASKIATGAGEPATDAEKEAAAKLAEANAKLAETVEAPKPEEPKKEAAKAAPAKAAAKGAAQPAQPQPPTSADILKKAVESAQKSGDAAAVEKVAAAKKEADAAKEVAAIAAPTPAPAPAAKAAKEAKDAAPAPAAPVAPDAEQAKEIAAKTDEAAAAKADVKVQLVDYSTKLAAERTGLIDRLKVVLDEIDLLGGDTKGMRAYIAAVSGLKVEVSDYQSTIARLKAWLTADEGGLRWARNVALFVAYLIGAWILSKIVRGALSRSIGMASSTSKLLRNFIIDTSGRAVMAVGFLAGLSALEIDLAPLLAVIGAAGFVVAFALQGTLSNFASGLLIMVNKPFDIGDDVEVGGDVKGRVEDVSIFATSVRTEDGMKKIVPNNSIWNNVIVNKSTGTTTASHSEAKTA
jgi:small conductance mechanosensitive channel